MPLRVLALTNTPDSDGCTFARIIRPLHTLEAAGQITYAQVYILPWHLATYRRIVGGLPNWDVIWFARPEHWVMLPIMREAQRLAKPVLVDIDDWLLDVPTESINAQFFRTRARQETIRMALRAADAITASTPILSERCVALGARAHVLPNAVACTSFTRQPRGEGPITIAFCGTVTHAEDVSLIALPLRQMLHSQTGRVRVVTVGCPIPELQGLQGYRHYERVPAPEYVRLLSDLRIDIGLAPLHDTPFNRAKSDIKYLEYSAIGAVTIASPVAPYQASVLDDRGIVVTPNTPEAWSRAISRLVEDTGLRQTLAMNAYEWVRSERSIEASAGKWYSLFDDYASGRLPGIAPGRDQLAPGRLGRALTNIVLREWPYYRWVIPRRVVQKTRLEVGKRLRQ